MYWLTQQSEVSFGGFSLKRQTGYRLLLYNVERLKVARELLVQKNTKPSSLLEWSFGVEVCFSFFLGFLAQKTKGRN